MLLFSWSNQYNQYRAWDPHTDTVFITNDAIFNEDHKDESISPTPTAAPTAAHSPLNPEPALPPDSTEELPNNQDIWLRPAKDMALAYVARTFYCFL